MTKFQKAVASAVASAALLLNVALPVLAGTTIEISGNGADSVNSAGVTVSSTTIVVQGNTADISNSVYAKADTGDNEANKNTGGSVSIDTGNAGTAVAISNKANSNVAEVDGCCVPDADVLISGNGADSKNTVSLGQSAMTSVIQSNDAEISNHVVAKADTGDNEAKKNTGGDVEIETGNAVVGVTLANAANSNYAKVGGGSGSGTVSARILDNGADSVNTIGLGLSLMVNLTQMNTADVENSVFAKADTGDNEAKKNTGGDVSIDTGNATVTVGIDNMVNFNAADIDCGGCLLNVLAKIAGNGANSKNTIGATLGDMRSVMQWNTWDCEEEKPPCGATELSGNDKKGCNSVFAKGDTGDNEVKKSTGDSEGDPTIETGDAGVLVDIENSGNANVVGAAPSWWPELPEMPDFPELPDFQFGFNWAFFWAWLGLSA